MIKCWKCKNSLEDGTKKCPNCNANQKLNKILLIILFLLIILIICLLLPNKHSSKDKIHIENGKLLEFKENCIKYDDNNKCLSNVAIIKVKIEQSYTNDATIKQNYYNIGNFVRNYDISNYDEIQYSAVADMTNGNELKIISFTVSKDIINKLVKEQIADNQLGTYVNNLFIIPELK